MFLKRLDFKAKYSHQKTHGKYPNLLNNLTNNSDSSGLYSGSN